MISKSFIFFNVSNKCWKKERNDEKLPKDEMLAKARENDIVSFSLIDQPAWDFKTH